MKKLNRKEKVGESVIISWDINIYIYIYVYIKELRERESCKQVDDMVANVAQRNKSMAIINATLQFIYIQFIISLKKKKKKKRKKKRKNLVYLTQFHFKFSAAL